MRATEKGDIGTDERTGADGNETCIYDCAIEVDKHVCAETNIGSVVDTDGSLDPGFLVELGSVLLGIG